MPHRFAAALCAALISIGAAWAGDTITGKASYYGCGDGFHGKRTASGVIFNAYGFSAAHRSLPFGTRLQIYLADKAGHRKGKPVVVRVNDRGPFVRGRDFDLSCGAARALGFTRAGTAHIIAKVLK